MITANFNEQDLTLTIYLTGEQNSFDGYSKAQLIFRYENLEAASIEVDIFLPSVMNFQSSMTIQFGSMVYSYFLKRWALDIEEFYNQDKPVEFSCMAEDFKVKFPSAPSKYSTFPISIEYEHTEYDFSEGSREAHFSTQAFVGHRENILTVSETIQRFLDLTGMSVKHPMA